jgi:hypothetical protein
MSRPMKDSASALFTWIALFFIPVFYPNPPPLTA